MNLAEQLEKDTPSREPRRLFLTIAPRAEDVEEDLAALARQISPQRLTDAEVESLLAAAAPNDAEPKETHNPPASSPQEEKSFPWSKAALFASITFILLLAVAYFHLQTGVERLTKELHDLAGIKSQVSRLDTKIGILETKMADLETLPAKTRAALLASILQELAHKTGYLAEQVGSAEQQEKLQRAKELVQQVHTELGAAAH